LKIEISGQRRLQSFSKKLEAADITKIFLRQFGGHKSNLDDLADTSRLRFD